MGAVIIVGERKLLQMLKDVIAHVVNDLLSDLVGVFDLVAKAEGTVKCGKQCQKAVKCDSLHVLVRDADVHDLLKKLRNQHGKSGSGEHHEADTDKPFPVRDQISEQTF